MVETREKDIRAKVITKSDLRRIWAIFEEQDKPKDTYRTHLSVQVRCVDGTRYEDEDGELLSDGSIIDLKKIETIDFRYRNYASDKEINVSLRNGNALFGNEMSIKGKDRNWLAGTFSKLEDVFDAASPQDHWFLRHKDSLQFLAALIFGIASFEIVHFTIGNHEKITKYIEGSSLSSLLLVGGGFFFVGYIFSTILVAWLTELWPGIEFQFGPEHLQFEKIKRNRIGIFITVLAIPLLLSMLPILL